MATIHDVPAEELIEELADRLEDRIEEPEWAGYVKTGESRELPPEQEDFWYRRAASLLRKVAMKEPIGVDRLSGAYGGRTKGSTRYRVAAEGSTTGSRKIIRVCLQQLEDEGLVSIAEGEGRRVTPEGHAFLDETADEVLADLDRPDLERYA